MEEEDREKKSLTSIIIEEKNRNHLIDCIEELENVNLNK